MVALSAMFPIPKARTERAIWNVLVELCTEIDLHYEDEDLFALGHTIEVIEELVNILREADAKVPPAAEDIIARFYRSRN